MDERSGNKQVSQDARSCPGPATGGFAEPVAVQHEQGSRGAARFVETAVFFLILPGDLVRRP